MSANQGWPPSSGAPDPNQPSEPGSSGEYQAPAFEYPPPTGQYPPTGQPSGPMQPSFPPPAPPKRNRSGLAALGVLLIIIVIAAGGWWLFLRDRSTTSASDLRVGDCIDEPAGTSDIKEVQHQPCSDPHDGEVFAIATHTAAGGASYPPESDFRTLANDQCLPALQTYTGMDLPTFVTQGYDFSAFYPSPDGWNDGSRDVTCYLVKADNTKITGSLKIGSAPTGS